MTDKNNDDEQIARINEHVLGFVSELKALKKNKEYEAIEELAYDLIHRIKLNEQCFYRGCYIPHIPYFALADIYAKQGKIIEEIEILNDFLKFSTHNRIYARSKEAITRAFKRTDDLNRYKKIGKFTATKKERCLEWGIPFTEKEIELNSKEPEKSFLKYLASKGILGIHEGGITKTCLDILFMKTTEKYYIENDFFDPASFGFTSYFRSEPTDLYTCGLNLPLEYRQESLSTISTVTRKEFKKFLKKTLAYWKRQTQNGNVFFDIELNLGITWADYELFSLAIFDDLGVEFFKELANLHISEPMSHVGWPDIELINNGKLELVEIKVKDNFTLTQIYTFPKLHKLLPDRISVVNLKS
ncbi:hypothetical protein N9121_00745 [Pseudomonadales bacterium]|nr:hypothetical protein [Pseudomonadales bacterium]